MELSLAKSPAICIWRWERKVVGFDCIHLGSHASDHVLVAVSPPLRWSVPGQLPTPITKAVKISSPWVSYSLSRNRAVGRPLLLLEFGSLF